MIKECFWIWVALLSLFYLVRAMLQDIASAVTSALAGPDRLHMEFEADCTQYQFAEIAEIFFVAYHENENRDDAINEVKNASWQLQYRLNQITPDGAKLAKNPDVEPLGPHLAWSIASQTGGIRYHSRRKTHTDDEDEYEDVNLHGKKNAIHWSQTVLKVEVNSVKTLLNVLDSLTDIEHTHVKGLKWGVSIPTAEKMHARARKGAIEEAKQKAYDFAREANNTPFEDVRILEIVKEDSTDPEVIQDDYDESVGALVSSRREDSQKETNIVTEPPQFRCVQRVQAKFVGCKKDSVWEAPIVHVGRKLVSLWNTIGAQSQKSVKQSM